MKDLGQLGLGQISGVSESVKRHGLEGFGDTLLHTCTAFRVHLCAKFFEVASHFVFLHGEMSYCLRRSTANLFQVSCVDFVGQGHKFFVPVRLAGLVASDEQNRGTPGIEGKENAIWPSLVLASQLTHIRKPGTPVDRIGVRPLEVNALLFQKPNGKIHAFLLIGVERVPPLLEFLGEFDLVRHEYYIPPK
jgi:hypothetical protein